MAQSLDAEEIMINYLKLFRQVLTIILKLKKDMDNLNNVILKIMMKMLIV